MTRDLFEFELLVTALEGLTIAEFVKQAKAAVVAAEKRIVELTQERAELLRRVCLR